MPGIHKIVKKGDYHIISFGSCLPTFFDLIRHIYACFSAFAIIKCMVLSALLLYRLHITIIPELFRLDKTDTASVPLVHHVNLTILLVAEHIEIMVDIIQSKNRFLHRNRLGKIVAKCDMHFKGKKEK